MARCARSDGAARPRATQIRLPLRADRAWGTSSRVVVGVVASRRAAKPIDPGSGRASAAGRTGRRPLSRMNDDGSHAVHLTVPGAGVALRGTIALEQGFAGMPPVPVQRF